MKIAVIGAGIIGTLTAYELQKRGHAVHVFEREPEPAMKCSKANGGQISICNAQTWNTWENVGKGLRWMLKEDAPLLIRPKLSRAKIKWIAGFLKHTLNRTHLQNTIDTIYLGQLSSATYKQIIQEENLKFDQSNSGMVHLYSDYKSLDAAMKCSSLFEDRGVPWKYITPEDLALIDPSLISYKNLLGGIITESDWVGDAHLFCKELQRISERNGAVFKFNAHVANLSANSLRWARTDGDEFFFNVSSGFDHIVLCNGHEIAETAATIGDDLNIYPVKGYSVTIPNVNEHAPSISILDDDKKIVSSRLGNRLRIAGTAELNGDDDSINEKRIKPLLDWCHENFPSVDTTGYEPWACLRPMNSNMMPIFQESKQPGIWYHGGHGHLGWTLGAATTKLLVQKMLQGT